MIGRCLFSFGALLATGCMHVDPTSIHEAKVSIWSIDCRSPIPFTKNCFENKASEFRTNIDGAAVLLSSTEDEKTVIIINRNFEMDLMWVIDPTSRTSARVMNLVRNKMQSKHQISMLRAIPVSGLRDVWGYIMIFDKPVFSKLVELYGPASNEQRTSNAENARLL